MSRQAHNGLAAPTHTAPVIQLPPENTHRTPACYTTQSPGLHNNTPAVVIMIAALSGCTTSRFLPRPLPPRTPAAATAGASLFSSVTQPSAAVLVGGGAGVRPTCSWLPRRGRPALRPGRTDRGEPTGVWDAEDGAER